MYRKNCDRCFRPSFSSSEFGSWICPTCGNDLTEYPFFDAFLLERLQIKAQLQDYKHKTLNRRKKNSFEELI
jgi:uncharacterized Zn finger protein (UPF0148 family)